MSVVFIFTRFECSFQVKRPSTLDVSPLSGVVLPGDRFKISIRFRPGIPDTVEEEIRLEVAHSKPEKLIVKGTKYDCKFLILALLKYDCKFLNLALMKYDCKFLNLALMKYDCKFLNLALMKYDCKFPGVGTSPAVLFSNVVRKNISEFQEKLKILRKTFGLPSETNSSWHYDTKAKLHSKRVKMKTTLETSEDANYTRNE